MSITYKVSRKGEKGIFLSPLFSIFYKARFLTKMMEGDGEGRSWRARVRI